MKAYSPTTACVPPEENQLPPGRKEEGQGTPQLLMFNITLNLLLFGPELFSSYFAGTLVAVVVLGGVCF